MTTKHPRICFGMTLYNNVRYLPEAIESLLNQTYTDFCLVAVDDCSTDNTEQVMRKYERQDKRISYIRNSQRLGLIDTWRLAFQKSFEMCNPPYFAWASDHDRWHKEWLFRHVKELDKHQDVSLAYPRPVDMSADGEILSADETRRFDTYGMSQVDRMYHSCTKQSTAGYAVYGLFRVDHLRKAGVFRRVVMPDRLLLMEISAYGTIRQIPADLWYRRVWESPVAEQDPGAGQVEACDKEPVAERLRAQLDETLARQRGTLFGSRPAPVHAHCPYVSHALSLLLHLSIFPASGSYATFWPGVLMASLLWEKYGDIFINHEFQKLRTLLAGEQVEEHERGDHSSCVTLDDDLLSNARFAKEMGILMNSLLGRAVSTPERFLSQLGDAIFLCTLMNHDSARSDLLREVESLRSQLGSAQWANEKLRMTNERLKTENERLKGGLSLTLAQRILGKLKKRV